MSNFSLIKRAIKDKVQIHATYNGHRRLMCPHLLGTKDGIQHALFLQFGGGSETGLSSNAKDNWRCLPLNELTEVAYFAGPFHSASNYSLDQSCIDKVDIEFMH
jgi:hypothetical protein